MKVATVLLLAFLACQVHAQIILFGRVLDQQGIPVPGAVLQTLPNGKPVYSDSAGKFRIPTSTAENLLQVVAVGFKRDTLKVANGQAMEIRLKEIERTGNEIVVSGERNIGQVDFKTAGLQLNIDRQEMRKAACCNLSESFETSPLVDVSYPDPVTGIRQIQMLGLSGQYTGYSVENQTLNPGVLGGFYATLIPGPWLQSIQVQKGIAPVSSGSGMLAGQINAAFLKADSNSPILVNGFFSEMGRVEGNLVLPVKKNESGGIMLFMHGNTSLLNMDMNSDGYRDFPIGKQVNAMVRSMHSGKKGTIVHLAAHAYRDERLGGDNNFKSGNPLEFNGFAYSSRISGIEISGKVGKVFPGASYRSIGLPWSLGWRENNQVPGRNRILLNEKYLSFDPVFQADLGKNGSGIKAGLGMLLRLRNEGIDQRLWQSTYQFTIPEQRIACFAEGSFVLSPGLLMVAGSRLEYHNLFGWWHAPRMHFRYENTDGFVLRLAAGQAWQDPSIFTQNQTLFSSGRKLILEPFQSELPYGLKAERGRSAELSATYNFRILPGKGSILLDVYAAEIQDQVVADVEQSGQLLIYNAAGAGRVRGAAVQFDQKLGSIFSLRLAYRYAGSWLDYRQGSLSRPLFAFHRGFLNLDAQLGSGFAVNTGLQLTGRKRIYGADKMSPVVPILNLQISKIWKEKFEASAGVENLTGFRQNELILFPSNPLSPQFDAASVWGPSFGRMIYLNVKGAF